MMPSLPQITILLAIGALIIVTVMAFGPALEKAGYSRWFSVLLLLPVVNIAAIWLFAFVRWPDVD